MQKAFGSFGASHEWTGMRVPGMHKTETIDYIIVLQGKVNVAICLHHAPDYAVPHVEASFSSSYCLLCPSIRTRAFLNPSLNPSPRPLISPVFLNPSPCPSRQVAEGEHRERTEGEGGQFRYGSRDVGTDSGTKRPNVVG